MKFSHTFRVTKDDIDEQGHVNNVAYLRWIQDVAVAHWRDAATQEMLEKFSWMVVRHEIDYRKQGFEDEGLLAVTWVGKWSRVTCERFTEIRRGSDLLANGRSVWCMIERSSGKPTRIGSDLIDLFA